LLKSFCDQLGCEPDEAEKVARRLAFLHGSGSTEPEFPNDIHGTWESQAPPERYRYGTTSLVKGDGISLILLSIASGIGVTKKYKVLHHPQPYINREITDVRLAIINRRENGIIDSYLNPNPKNGMEQVGFAFLPFVMEQSPKGSKNHEPVGGDLLVGVAQARLITLDDVEHLQRVLKVKVTLSGDMTTEQRLHLVFQVITKNFNCFKSRDDLQNLLQLLLLSVKTVDDGSIDAAALYCWDDIREVIYLTKVAWVALKLPCLGAIAGKARMYAATHALLGIKATSGGGPPYENTNLQLPPQIPLSLTQLSSSVEFYANEIGKDETLKEFLFALLVESVKKQTSVTRSSPYCAQELLAMLVHETAIEPILEEGKPWSHESYIKAIICQVKELEKKLMQLDCPLVRMLNSLGRSSGSKKSTVGDAIKRCMGEKKYVLGLRDTLDFSEIDQQIKNSSVQVSLFLPLVGLLKIKTGSNEILSPHQALVNLINNNGQQREEEPSSHPSIPFIPTVGTFENLTDRRLLHDQILWTRSYIRDFMCPIVAFMAQWLCDLPVNEESPSQLGKDLVCQWVWAFVWELLQHYGGPYIDISWLRKLEGVDNLNLLLRCDQDPRTKHFAKHFATLNYEGEFSSNLFGLVVYLICAMKLEHFTLARSFNPVLTKINISSDQDESALDDAIYTATCPRFNHDGVVEYLSLFQMTQCLLADTTDAKMMAKDVNARLGLWGISPSVVLKRLFDAAEPINKDLRAKKGEDLKSEKNDGIPLTAAKLRLVLSWWVPKDLEEPDIDQYNTPKELETLLDKHIQTALAPLQAKQLKKRLRGEDPISADKLKKFSRALEFVEIGETKESDKGSDTESDKGSDKGSDKEADKKSDEESDKEMPEPPTRKRKRRKGKKGKGDKGSADKEMSKSPEANPVQEGGASLDENMTVAPTAEPNKEMPKSPEADPEQEGGASLDENTTKAPTAEPKSPSGKPPTPSQPPSDAGASDEDDASTRCEKRWKRLGVDKWPPTSKEIPDSNLTKEVLLMPCLDNSVYTETGENKVQFRKLTLGAIQCYICDFVPQKYLKEMVLFHHSEAFRKCYSKSEALIDPYNVDVTEKEAQACNRFAKMNENDRRKVCKGSYCTYYSSYEGDQSYWYEKGFSNAKKELQFVDDFMKAIAKGVKEARKKELDTDIDFKEMHAVAITTINDASHQRAHLDNSKAYEDENAAPTQRAYIGHMPLQSEGMVLRLENLTDEMLNFLDPQEKGVLNQDSELVEDHLYLHIPFGSILLIDDRTFHGGHYGTADKHRFHFVLSPYAWTPWIRTKVNATANSKEMENADKEGDLLLFLMQVARLHPRSTWKKGDDDPNVAMPQLDTIMHLDLSKISKKKEYWQKRRPFCEQIAKALLEPGRMKEELIRYIIDN
jgi:hypothetical protein